jgi:integrase
MAAAEADDLIPTKPVRKGRFPRRGPRKERAEISPEKIRELLAALLEPSGSVARLVVCTGLRIGEALALRWGDVDLERRILRVTQNVYYGHYDEPKSQRSGRSVPLGAAMSVEVLSALKPAGMNPEALVFSTDKGTPFDRHNLVNRLLKPTCKKLGLTGVGWH